MDKIVLYMVMPELIGLSRIATCMEILVVIADYLYQFLTFDKSFEHKI